MNLVDRRISAPLAVAALLGGLLAGCAGGEGGGDGMMEESASSAGEAGQSLHMPLSLSETQQEGQRIYETVCWTCHGEAGRGNGPAVQAGSIPAPPDFTTGDYASLTASDLRARFGGTSGRESGGHPHMESVKGFLEPEAFSAALSYVTLLSWPAEVPGSALAGREVYEVRCQACHGDAGEGNGPASDQLVTQPADFTRDTLISNRNFQLLYDRIRQGGDENIHSSMPPWGVVYSDNDIWDLVAYVGTFQEGIFEPPAGPGQGQ